jgi:GNAT superfamily N-acetyltransferase
VSEVIDFPCNEEGLFTSPPQLISFSVVNIADAKQHWQRAAELSVNEWKEIFTEDSVQTYLDLYGKAGTYAGRLVETYVALSSDDELVGMATLVDDDELPNAPESGPWLAAVLTLPTYRGRGVASAVVQRIVRQAHELGIPALYLYTSDQQQWYANKGWIPLRETELNGIAHTVMTLRLTN